MSAYPDTSEDQVGAAKRRLRLRKKNKTYRRKGKTTRKVKKSKGKKSKGSTCYVYKYVKRSCKNLKM
jgi:hypothetical protein